MTTPANWYPDPNGRAELRYWNGEAWTEHVSTDGTQSTDPVGAGASPGLDRLDRLDKGLTVGNEGRPDKIQEQLTGQGIRGAGLTGKVEGGGGTILTEPVLVVNQKAKLIELNNQYSVFGQDGQQLAMVNQVGQSTAKKAMRLVSSLDQFMTHKLEITDNRRARAAAVDPATQGDQVDRDRRRRRWQRDRQNRAAEGDRQDQLRTRGKRPDARLDQG